jgi:DNA polymerase-3 subunit gamma/tau
MAHQSLYRKYRPQTFADVVGQEHIVRTLRNAVAEGTTSHAYLFTGPRGTGKTTTARLLAKSLDCEKGPTADPDVTCPSCVDIAHGRHPDVYELDAASRTGVDAVREEIITKVHYAATRGGWKVYIIDEVHMLSTSAFNALLKTLEEPPDDTVFVLCTTHPQKVPDTIHSRCQRFDFHRISVEAMVEQLERIADAEGVERDEGVSTLIARHAAGGLRDAISTLEQLAVYTGNRIGLEDVEGLLGEVDSSLLVRIADLIAERDIAGAFRFVAERADVGTDMAEFARGMIGHFRDLYVVSSVEDALGIVEVPESDLERLRAQAARFGPERLARGLDLLGELLTEIRWSSDPRLALEVTLARMADPRGDRTIEALEERVASLEAGYPARPAPAAAGQTSAERPAEAGERSAAAEDPAETTKESGLREASEASGGPGDAPVAAVEVAAEAEPEAPDDDVAPPVAGAPQRAAVKRAWPTVLALLRKRTGAPKAQLFASVETDTDGEYVVIEFPADQKLAMEIAEKDETRSALGDVLGEVLGGTVKVRFQLGRGPVRPPEDAGAQSGAGPEGTTERAETERSDAASVSPEASDLEQMLIRDFDAEIVEE